MVGTFYAASGPDKPPMVSVGTVVDADTVVCLLEAMKIFNEIKAERAGTIAKVLVKSGQAVEFGQRLFLIRPN
jgi:acetyl-CoA carboxylase biotin carboxyl carrier protein